MSRIQIPHPTHPDANPLSLQLEDSILSSNEPSTAQTNTTQPSLSEMPYPAVVETVIQPVEVNHNADLTGDEPQQQDMEMGRAANSVEITETISRESSPIEVLFNQLEDQIIESTETPEASIEGSEQVLQDGDGGVLDHEQSVKPILVDVEDDKVMPDDSEKRNDTESTVESISSPIDIMASGGEIEDSKNQPSEDREPSRRDFMELVEEHDLQMQEEPTITEVNVSESSIEIAIPEQALDDAEISADAKPVERVDEAKHVYQTPVKVILNTISEVNNLVINDANVIESPSPISRLMQPAEIDPATPTLEDVTATITLSSLAQLEDDKAILRSFLDRAAASKENRVVMGQNQGTNCSRRESFQNRRDSDTVRQALASPRQPFEDKDGNTFYPQKLMQSNPTGSPKANKLDAALDIERILPPIDELLSKSAGKGSPRRSKRSKSTGSHPNIVMPDKKQISLRRNDGNDTLTLTKTASQLAALETRRNTRKNKGSALSVQDRIVKWRADLTVLGIEGASPGPKGLKVLKESRREPKAVKWSETLYFLNEATGQSEPAPLLDNAQAPKTVEATDVLIESSVEEESTPAPRSKRKVKQQSTKSRRVRGLGVTNGTPAKGVLAATLLPDELAEGIEDKGAVERSATVTLTAVAASTTKTNKSRLLPPSKLNLNPSVKSVSVASVDSKDDGTRSVQIKKLTTSKKQVSMLPVAGASSKRGMRK
jgi:hypothetical protein